MHITRREFVLGVVVSGTAPAFLTGCGGSSSPGPSKRGGGGGGHTEAKDVILPFDDTASFYDQLSKALANGQNVTLTFEGPHRISKESRLMKEFVKQATNWKELYNSVTSKDDTEEGRDQLKSLFAEDLLEHSPAKTSAITPSGEVIEPTTVILVLGLVLILAAASVAHAESARGRSYRIEMVGESSGKMRLSFSSDSTRG